MPPPTPTVRNSPRLARRAPLTRGLAGTGGTVTSPCSHGTFLHRCFGPALTVPRTPLLPAPAFLPPRHSPRSLRPRSSSSASAPQLLPVPGPGSALPAPPSTPNLTDPSRGPSTPFCAHRVPGPATTATHPRFPPGPRGPAVPWCQTHCVPQHPLSLQRPASLGAPTPRRCTLTQAAPWAPWASTSWENPFPSSRIFPEPPSPPAAAAPARLRGEA